MWDAILNPIRTCTLLERVVLLLADCVMMNDTLIIPRRGSYHFDSLSTLFEDFMKIQSRNAAPGRTPRCFVSSAASRSRAPSARASPPRSSSSSERSRERASRRRTQRRGNHPRRWSETDRSRRGFTRAHLCLPTPPTRGKITITGRSWSPSSSSCALGAAQPPDDATSTARERPYRPHPPAAGAE